MIIKITWLDACGEESYVNLECAKKLIPLTRINVGLLIQTTPKFITIAAGVTENLYNEDKGYSGVLCIPQGMVVKVEQLDADA